MLFTFGCAEQETTPNETESTTPSTPNTPKEPTLFPIDIESTVGFVEQALKTHVNAPLEDLTGIAYYIYKGRTVPRGVPHGSSNVYTHQLNAFPYIFGAIEYIAMTANDRLYIVMKLDQVDGSSTYVYRFFKRKVYEAYNAPGTYVESWSTKDCEVYYASNSLAYNEFTADFAVGDTMEKAISISLGLAFDLDMRYDYDTILAPHREETVTQTCHLLLEDGVLVLRFESTCSTDEWEDQGKPDSMLICTEMEFYPNGTPATVDGIELSVLTAPADKRPPLPQADAN